MTRDELLTALMVERYDNRWWTTRATDLQPDDEFTTARRRRDLLREDAAVRERDRVAR